MYFAVAVNMLGMTRYSHIVAYNSEDLSFRKLSVAKAKKMITEGQLKGLLVGASEEEQFIPDTEGWNQTNIIIESSCRCYPFWSANQEIVNTMYSVVKKTITDAGESYTLVSNYCQRLDNLSANNIIELASITAVGGVRIVDGAVQIIAGVQIEDRRTSTEPIEVRNKSCATKNTKKKHRTVK